MKYALSLTLFLFFSLGLYAQQITGTVKNEHGEPPAHVTVRALSTDQTSMSDSLGNYAINISSQDRQLSFSAVGFITQSLDVDDRQHLDIILQEDHVSLHEVVVIGYGAVEKKDLTGSRGTPVSGDG